MEIKNILFDLGGVILTNDWNTGSGDFENEFSTTFSVSIEDARQGFKAMWPDFQRGIITEEDFWEGLLKISGAEIDLEKAMDIWRKNQRSIDGMLELLGKIKKSYKLGVISIISKEWFDFKKEKFNLNYYFDMIATSGYTGISKPDKRIYEFVLEKMKIKPEETIFIDDQEKNLIPARELGMRTILFKNREDLEISLREMGIII